MREMCEEMSCCPKYALNALKSDGTFKGSKINLKDVSYYATQNFDGVKSVLIFYPDVRRFTFYLQSHNNTHTYISKNKKNRYGDGTADVYENSLIL